jgi:transposase
MRTARSITSGENFGDFRILAPFSIEGASSKAGAVQPRWHMHFIPTYSSWLNQIERFFSLITDKAIRRGST